MTQAVLNVITTAYRATLEEQDDPVLWLTHVPRGAGADVHVLLTGNAVNYAVRGQDSSGLAFGEKKQTQPADLARDLTSLKQKGATVYFIEEDAQDRGIQKQDLIEGVEVVRRQDVARLYDRYPRVWQW